MTRYRPLFGAVFWIALLSWLGVLLFGDPGDGERPGSRQRWDNLTRYAFGEVFPVEVEFDTVLEAKPGDLFYEDQDGELIAVGEVVGLEVREGRSLVRAEIFPRAARFLGAETTVTHFTASRTAAWALATLLPPERIEGITADARETFLAERTLVFDLLKPHFRRLGEEVVSGMSEELPRVLRRHESRIREILQRHRVAIVEGELMPLVNDQIWPIVKEESIPLLRIIGQELWETLPKWSLGLMWAYEHFPGVEDDKVAERFQLFLQQDGIPILVSHTDDLIELTRTTARRVIDHPEVDRVVNEALVTISSDPELKELIRVLLADLTYENRRLQDLLRDSWSDPAFRDSLSEVLRKFDALITRTVKVLLLNEEQDGINLDLARVLRTKVLGKDKSWFLVDNPPSPRVGKPPVGPTLPPGHRFPGRQYTPPW